VGIAERERLILDIHHVRREPQGLTGLDVLLRNVHAVDLSIQHAMHQHGSAPTAGPDIQYACLLLQQ
jgi:hypothetical protein